MLIQVQVGIFFRTHFAVELVKSPIRSKKLLVNASKDLSHIHKRDPGRMGGGRMNLSISLKQRSSSFDFS